MGDRLSTLFSPTTIDHFRHPRNVGRLENPSAVGRAEDPATENQIELYLLVEHGRVLRATFRTFGCSACVAASSVVTELLRDRSVDAARCIDAHAILEALDGLPLDRIHCARLAAGALTDALARLTV